MVRPEGFEPPISGTGNLRFIQLSYGRTCYVGYHARLCCDKPYLLGGHAKPGLVVAANPYECANGSDASANAGDRAHLWNRSRRRI
jgi:hypothetical protein